jgi:hypothetical protein
MSEPEASVRPSPDVVAQGVGGETVLVQLETNKIFTLNATGARFWELLSAGLEPDEIVERLLGEFDVEEKVLREEIDSLVESLVREHLVTDRDPE